MKVLYIDPQSIYNLAQYDYNLLNNVNAEITYCCNVKYDAKILDKVNYKYVFGYSEYSLQALKALSYIISIFKIMLIVCKVRPDVIHIQWWRLFFLHSISSGCCTKNSNKEENTSAEFIGMLQPIGAI